MKYKELQQRIDGKWVAIDKVTVQEYNEKYRDEVIKTGEFKGQAKYRIKL